MERIKSLNWYQKAVLLIMIVMVLVFTVIYPITIAKVGFEYRDVILTPTQGDGYTVYSGDVQGTQISFTVYEDKTVEFECDGNTYAPYTLREDPAAIPEDSEVTEYTTLTGIELRQGDAILFRGGMIDGDNRWLYNEDGSIEDTLLFSMAADDGAVFDENGNAIDSMEPSIYTILELMGGPKLTHKGDWAAWFGGVFCCVLTAISILYVEELFHWHMSFQIRDADRAEPSDWEIAGRYFAWTVVPLIALALFIVGLA